MGQPVGAVAFWARRNKPIWRASVDPVGQPAPWPAQNHPEFLNDFSFLHSILKEFRLKLARNQSLLTDSDIK
jgi:hypothetical protein